MTKLKKKLIGIAIAAVLLAVGLYYVLSRGILADVTQGPYVIFQKENFSQVTSDTLPNSGEILAKNAVISTFAAQGQTEDVSFSVRPNQELGEIQLNLSDLRMGDKIIPKENIEILNLKVWDQCGKDGSCALESALHVNTSELLLADGTENPVDIEKALNPNVSGTYKLPQFNGAFKAILRSGQTHTFYLRIKVPEDAVAGTYAGNIHFQPQSQPGKDIGLSLRIYPFVLPETDKNIGAFSTLRVDDKPQSGNPGKYVFQGGWQSIGLDNYKAYLKSLRESGMNTLVVADYNNIVPIAVEAKRLGFKQIIWRAVPYPHVPSWNPWQNDQQLNDIVSKAQGINEAGFEPIIYGCDEIISQERIVATLNLSKKLKQKAKAKGFAIKVASTIPKQFFNLYNSDDVDIYGFEYSDGTKIDIPIYNAGYSKTDSYSALFKYDVKRSWIFAVSTINYQSYSGSTSSAAKAFDVPKFSPFVDGKAVSTDQDNATMINPENNEKITHKYKDTLAPAVWHHVAGVWNGLTKTYNLYVDDKDRQTYSYTFNAVNDASPFDGMITKNTNRTIIGSSLTADGAKGNSSFHGQIARVKIYNKALTKEEIDKSGTEAESTQVPLPAADFDFSGKTTSNKITNQACEMRAGNSKLPEWIDNDSPFSAGASSLNFNNNIYGKIDYSTGQPVVTGAENQVGPFLDCGNNSNNFGISDQMTVEAWIKLPERGQDTEGHSLYSNISNGTIISQMEGSSSPGDRVEDYIENMLKGTVKKNKYPEYYYNQIWYDGSVTAINGTIPEYKRALSGFYLQASGLDGYTPFGLDSMYTSTALPYNDFDSNEKSYFCLYPAAGSDGIYKPMLTRQFEAYRSGIDDSRYLTLYNKLLADISSRDSTAANEINSSLKQFLDKLPYNSTTTSSFAEMNPPNKDYIVNSQYQAARKLVADKIVYMQNTLKQPDPVTPAPTPPVKYIKTFNVANNQTITSKKYMLSVQVTDPTNVSKVEFYVNDKLIGSQTQSDVNAVYDWLWAPKSTDTRIKVIVYGVDGSTEEMIRTVRVKATFSPRGTRSTSFESPAIVDSIIVLPKTGGESWLKNISSFVEMAKRKILEF